MPRSPVPFAAETLETVQRAFHDARARRHDAVGLEHLLVALTHEVTASQILAACGANLETLRSQATDVLDRGYPAVPGTAKVEPEPTIGFDRVIQHAVMHAAASSAKEVSSGDLLVFMLQEDESHAAYFLKSSGVERLSLLRAISHGETDPSSAAVPGTEPAAPAVDPLEAYATNLNAMAAEGRIDPLIGRAAEIERMVQVLCRRRKNNPLLVGEPGVGKTALAEGLALRIHQGNVPEPLKDAVVFALDLGALVAGTRYRGDFEERVKQVLDRLAKQPGAILFIDEIHTLVGAGAASGGAMDGGNLLKPALASGALRCIGSTTFSDVKQSFDRDRALARRFQKIDIVEPTPEEALEILKGLKPQYESHHGVTYSDEALEAAVALSAKYLKDLHLPDKAIDVLDEAGSHQKLLPADMRPAVIGPEQIERIVAKMARVPVQAVSHDDTRALAELEPALRQVIFGQDAAIAEVASAIKMARSGLRGADKPIGSFLFTGPTGVGKTELAKQLARILGVSFIRYDMSEYMEKHAVSRLIGAPPGYVGYEEGGLLIDAVRKSPHAVLLLDEIEKAHPDMYAILLQVMDHATLTDSHGRKADFRHVILIMTTNAGARDVSDRKLGFADTGLGGGSTRGALERTFTPEFRNRLDGVVTFGALGTAEVERVVDKQIDELRGLVAAKGVRIELEPAARAWLARKGFDRAFGARPMARLVDRVIKKPLSERLLFGSLAKGGTVRIGVDNDAIVLVEDAAA